MFFFLHWNIVKVVENRRNAKTEMQCNSNMVCTEYRISDLVTLACSVIETCFVPNTRYRV